MARTTKPLTNTEVKQAKAREKVYSLTDGDGLQLRVKPNGSKIWLLDYRRPYTKVRTSLSFGAYPDVSLADARQKRTEARALLAKDIDPKEHRDERARENAASSINTLKHVAGQWLRSRKPKYPPTMPRIRGGRSNSHIFPSLGKVPIHKITAVKAIETIKPVAMKGNLETVKRLCQRLNEVMTFAVELRPHCHESVGRDQQCLPEPRQTAPTDHRPGPARYTHEGAEQSQHQDHNPLPHRMAATHHGPSGEAAGTRWDEIDLDAKVWNIPAERMKKNKAHAVPLSPQAIELLEVMRPISGKRKFVFPSDRNPRTHTHPSTANMALKRMGFDKRLVAHGLRALASTTLNEQGFDPEIIESALAHTGQNEVRNAYNRAEYIARRIPLMNWWSEHIEKPRPAI